MTNTNGATNATLPWDVVICGAATADPHVEQQVLILPLGMPQPWSKSSKLFRTTRTLRGELQLRMALASPDAVPLTFTAPIPLSVEIARGTRCYIHLQIEPEFRLTATLNVGEQEVGSTTIELEPVLDPRSAPAPVNDPIALLARLSAPVPPVDVWTSLCSLLLAPVETTLAALVALPALAASRVLERCAEAPVAGLALLQHWASHERLLSDELRISLFRHLYDLAERQQEQWQNITTHAVDELAAAAFALAQMYDLEMQAEVDRRLVARTRSKVARLEDLKRTVDGLRELVQTAQEPGARKRLEQEREQLRTTHEQLQQEHRSLETELVKLREDNRRLTDTIKSQLTKEKAQLQQEIENLAKKAAEIPDLRASLERSQDPGVRKLAGQLKRLEEQLLKHGLEREIEAIYAQIEPLLGLRPVSVARSGTDESKSR